MDGTRPHVAGLTVGTRIETARRIEHYFAQGEAFWQELHERERLLRVDSKVLEKAEIGEKATADKDYEAHLHAIVEALDLPPDRKERLLALKKEELLREIVHNVGKRGTAGQGLQKVISVAMLSEGWDAKNVTHLEHRVGGLLPLRSLVEAAESFSAGELSSEAFEVRVRSILSAASG